MYCSRLFTRGNCIDTCLYLTLLDLTALISFVCRFKSDSDIHGSVKHQPQTSSAEGSNSSSGVVSPMIHRRGESFSSTNTFPCFVYAKRMSFATLIRDTLIPWIMYVTSGPWSGSLAVVPDICILYSLCLLFVISNLVIYELIFVL